jgi:hypothetical protein
MIHRVLNRILPNRLRLSGQAHQMIETSAGGKVCSGPFAGMAFASPAVHPKYLLGTYELELSPLILRLSKLSFERIVDVGAETGYYAIGLAWLNPHARIFAYEADEKFHAGIRAMARINHLEDRVVVDGFCKPHHLAAHLKGSNRCLIFMDCEGGEKLLLDPSVIPELTRCHILVELHDFVYRDIAEIIGSRFRPSHTITEIWSRPRSIGDFPLPTPRALRTWVFRKYYVSAMNEGRPERMRWYYLEPATK